MRNLSWARIRHTLAEYAMTSNDATRHVLSQILWKIRNIFKKLQALLRSLLAFALKSVLAKLRNPGWTD